MNRKPIFDAVRVLRSNKPFSKGEVEMLDRAIDRAEGKGVTTYSLSNPSKFFDEVRKITGKLEQVRVDSVNAILRNANEYPLGIVAYLLATAWHEARFEPQEEWGKGKGRPYAKKGKYGQPQYGRGLVQLTWDRNYEKADRALALGGKLLDDFDLALDPEIAAQILVQGSVEGWFTGKKLADYILADWGTFPQFVGARRVINGNDRAADIAELALSFQDALSQGGWS